MHRHKFSTMFSHIGLFSFLPHTFSVKLNISYIHIRIMYSLDLLPYVATADCLFFVLHQLFKITERTIEKK